MILQIVGNEADELCGCMDARIGFFWIATCKTPNVIGFDLSLMYFSCLIYVNRVVYGSTFQILFGETFKCIHDIWSKF